MSQPLISLGGVWLVCLGWTVSREAQSFLLGLPSRNYFSHIYQSQQLGRRSKGVIGWQGKQYARKPLLVLSKLPVTIRE